MEGADLIDYHAHTLALEEASKTLAAATFTDAALVSARNQTQMDLSVAGGHALLGALMDHLLTHAVSDGSELALLDRAADLWTRGVALYNDLGSVRDRIESALGAPGIRLRCRSSTRRQLTFNCSPRRPMPCRPR